MRDGFYKWAVVGLLWIVALLNYVDRQVIFSVFPLLEKDLHLSSVALGLTGTVFLWVYGFLSPFSGYFADRFGRRSVILAGLLVWSAVTWLTGHARNFQELLALRAVMGISEAFYIPAALALVSDYHSEATRSRAVGLHQSGLYTGIALGGLVGGWMGDHYGWRAAFTILGIVGLGYTPFLFAGLRDRVQPPNSADNQRRLPFIDSMLVLTRTRPFLVLVAANSLSGVAYWCVYTWLATFLYEKFHLSLTIAGFSSTFYIQAASFVGILLGGWAADSWARRNQRARVLLQSLGMAAAGPFLFAAAVSHSWWSVLPCLICFGLGRGIYDCNLMPVVCQIVPAQLRASAYGILNLTSCVAGGVMAVGSGALKEIVGLGGAIQLSAVLLMVGALLLLMLRVPMAMEAPQLLSAGNAGPAGPSR